MGWLFLILVIVSTLTIGGVLRHLERKRGWQRELTLTQRRNLGRMAEAMRKSGDTE